MGAGLIGVWKIDPKGGKGLHERRRGKREGGEVDLGVEERLKIQRANALQGKDKAQLHRCRQVSVMEPTKFEH